MPAQDLATVAPAFVEMAHRIVWCAVATVDRSGRPRTRVLHPIWEWDGTSPASPKAADLAATPLVSLTYWAPSHDTCTADCAAEFTNDPDSRRAGWELRPPARSEIPRLAAIERGRDVPHERPCRALRGPVRRR